MENLPDIDAMLLDAFVAQAVDPVTRFVESLTDPDLQRRARETIRLRGEFERNARRVLVGDAVDGCLMAAQWLAQNGREVAYRWSSLLRVVRRWGEVQTDLVARIPVSDAWRPRV